jgi:2-C-methyl-D-erythritol 4-phosphate cytidylyltransferase
MNRAAVIVAGGSGTRMGKELPKQFLKLKDKVILIHSISVFLKAYPDIRVIVVLPAEYISYTEQLLSEESVKGDIVLVEGGATRFNSVKNGLGHIGNADIVFVHDAVRCLVSTQLIQSCSDAAAQYGSAIPVIPVRDSMRRVNPAENTSTIVERDHLVIVQTPQTFQLSMLLPAFDVEYHPMFTDEASVVEKTGQQVHLIPGEETNIKITFPEDLAYAEWVLGNRE